MGGGTKLATKDNGESFPGTLALRTWRYSAPKVAFI